MFARGALLATALMLAGSCGGQEARLEHGGVSIELPEGWEGRVLSPPGMLQAANFAFAPVGRELPAGEQDPIKAMTPRHALVAILPCGLVSFEGSPRPAPERVSLRDLTFLAGRHPRVPRGHAFAQASFDFPGRCLRIEADFGGSPPARELKDAVNDLLGSLSVR